MFFEQVVRHCEHGLRESIIQELAVLSGIVKHHMRSFLGHISDLICEYWADYLEQVVTRITVSYLPFTAQW